MLYATDYVKKEDEYKLFKLYLLIIGSTISYAPKELKKTLCDFSWKKYFSTLYLNFKTRHFIIK